MSDEETFEKINDDVENIDNEQNALIIQELIALVERNPPLYAKNWKEYAGKNFCKDLAWENIGSNLSRQISGKDAARIWYNIRQRFGRERRKVTAALKGKSGTFNNYTKNVKMTTTMGNTSLSPLFSLPSPLPSSSSLLLNSTSSSQALSPQVLSPQVLSLQASSPQARSPLTPSPQARSPLTPSPQAQSPLTPSPQARSPLTPSPQASYPLTPSPQAPSPQASVLLSPSSIWSASDLETVFGTTDDSASVISIEDSEEKKALLHASTLSSNNFNTEECSAASVTAPSTSKEVLKAMKRISTSTTKTVPELDNFAKRRKKDDNLLVQTITKQSTALTSIASKLEKSLAKDSGEYKTPSSASFIDDPVLNAIGYAFKSVPEEKRLECTIELLQIIKSKYAQ